MSKAEVFERLKKLSTALGSEIDQDMLMLYTEAISVYPIEQVRIAINQAFLTSRKFPPPAVLIDLIDPVSSEAVLLMEKITYSIREFGLWRSSEAAEHIGTRGWEVVNSIGGWSYLCNSKPDQLSFLKSKIQEVLKSKKHQSIKNSLIEKQQARIDL